MKSINELEEEIKRVNSKIKEISNKINVHDKFADMESLNNMRFYQNRLIALEWVRYD